jgi:hypothetical protein
MVWPVAIAIVGAQPWPNRHGFPCGGARDVCEGMSPCSGRERRVLGRVAGRWAGCERGSGGDRQWYIRN